MTRNNICSICLLRGAVAVSPPTIESRQKFRVNNRADVRRYRHSRDRDSMTWVEQRAVEAMCAVLCCGPIFEPAKALGDDGYLYPWLEALLTSQNEMVRVLLLHKIGVT
jgi:hypothetical protein